MERLDYSVSGRLLNLIPCRLIALLVACVFALSSPVAAQAQIAVTTYHGDTERTGWNPFETILTPSSVTPTTFGLIATTALNDQVDAQPLVVANQNIEGQGLHTVVYVATESNTVYAIDSLTGNILKTAYLGAPVVNPLHCYTFPNVGITSTPVIDLSTQTIYLVAYTLVAGEPSYQLHGLNLQTLEDYPGFPITVSGSHSLTNGSTFEFDATVERQRPALLEINGNVYAAFGSFCDSAPNSSRGWLLAWNVASRNAFGSNELTNTLTSVQSNFFLSAIWMSGYGVADDGAGNIFFATANSNPNVNTYTGTANIEESVVRMPEALTSVLDIFTPSNAFALDQKDTDFGAGGVLVLPDQPGPVPHLAVAAGKDGRLFILNRDDLGGFHNPDFPPYVQIGGCWCGESYYQGSDGVGRVVTSGGSGLPSGDSLSNVETWTVNTFRSPPLTLEASSQMLETSPQDPGFFTTVSSNGTQPNSAIIWAIGRPTCCDTHITLYAFNGTRSGGTLPTLWSGRAGFWPYLSGDADLVPTVANGLVYVATYRQLAIFGLIPQGEQPAAKLKQPVAAPFRPAGALFWGTVQSVRGSRIKVVLRTGKLLQVDLSGAFAQGTTIEPVVGQHVAVNGNLDQQGVLEARFMWRAKGPGSWGSDSRG
jgi:hypothetical protein